MAPTPADGDTMKPWITALLLGLCLQAQAFDLQGHRGARGLAPENTMVGFERTLAIGVTTLETDIAITRDGVLVISHDPALNPDITRGPDGQFLGGARAGDLAHRLCRAAALRRRPPEARHTLCRAVPGPERRTTARGCRSWKSCSRW